MSIVYYGHPFEGTYPMDYGFFWDVDERYVSCLCIFNLCSESTRIRKETGQLFTGILETEIKLFSTKSVTYILLNCLPKSS